MNTLSVMARKLIAEFEAEYIEQGYMYGGCLSLEDIENAVGRDAAGSALAEAEAAGAIRVRDCVAPRWELTPDRRKTLIVTHDLAAKWEQRAPRPPRPYAPSSPEGRVKVWKCKPHPWTRPTGYAVMVSRRQKRTLRERQKLARQQDHDRVLGPPAPAVQYSRTRPARAR